jgi:hypothetical protein
MSVEEQMGNPQIGKCARCNNFRNLSAKSKHDELTRICLHCSRDELQEIRSGEKYKGAPY